MVAWENSRLFATPPLVSSKWRLKKRAQKFHTDDVSLPRSMWFFWLVVPRRVISMEFLQSFLRLRFAGTRVHGGVAKCRLFPKLLSNKFHKIVVLCFTSRSHHTRQTPLYSRHLCFSSAVINIVDFSLTILTSLSFGYAFSFNDFVWNEKSSECSIMM